MGKGVRQSRVSIRSSRGRDPVQRLLPRAVADSVYVNDQSLLVGGDTQLGELLGIKQQISIAAGILIRFAQVRRLGGILRYSVREHLDSSHVQVRNVLISLAGLLHSTQFGGWIFRKYLRKCDPYCSQLSGVGQHFV